MKVINKVKYFTLGMLVMSAICMIMVPAFGDSGTKKIEAVFNNIKLYVNGAIVTPKDSNGNIVEPFTYNGTIYVPARTAAEALGKNIRWDANTASLYIGDTIPAQSQISQNAYFDSLKNATTMESAATPFQRNKFIKTTRDYDTDTYYKIDLKEGQGLTVALKPQINKGSMSLYLCDIEGSSLVSSKYLDNEEYGTVGVKAEKNMTIYAKVSGEAGIYYIGFYDQYHNNTSSMNDERDFFGTIMTSKIIEEGIFEKAEEYYDHYYRIDIKEGQTITVNMKPQINKGSMSLFLYDIEGSSLDSDKYLDNGDTGTVSKKAASDGTFFIAIKGVAGKYRLNYVIK